MALVMSASTFMSSMVVYASGINNYVDELDLQNEYVNSEQDKYHNDEAAEVAEKSEAVKAMNQQVEKAQAAVKDAQDAVTEAEEAVTEAEADEKVDGLEAKDTPKGIDEYNAQVADDQDEIDKNEQVSNVANAAAATAANEADKASEAADAAKAAAKINGETSYNNELEKKKKEMEDAEKAYNDCSEWMFVDKMLLKLAYDNAKSEYDAYNSPDKKNEVVNNYIENDDAVKAANANVICANSELLELNKQYTKEAGLLAAETATRDAYIADATKNADAEMREAFVDEIKTILNKYSDGINQIDYDEDLNAWANDTFNTWYLYDKGLVCNKMNDKYVDSLLESMG